MAVFGGRQTIKRRALFLESENLRAGQVEIFLCAQCSEPIPEWYLKISAGIWCQNCDDEGS
jgi:hypothetical protein